MKNAAQQILVPPSTLFILIMLSQDLLHLGKGILVYQWLMSPFGWDIAQFHPGLTKVEAVMEDITPFRPTYPVPQPAAITERISMICP